MATNSFDARANRSAELQRLLDDAEGRPTPRPTNRSPLRSSPPTTFPRRNAVDASKATVAGDGATRGTDLPGDPADRLRRSALVRSPGGSAGVRRRGKVVPASTKTAVARSLAGRWGAAGSSPSGPQLVPVTGPARQPATASRHPVSIAKAAASPVPNRPAAPGRARTGRPASALAAPAVAASVTAVPGPATAPSRPRQRRALALAGGVAAAVVAIVAIVSFGNRGGAGPAADAGTNPNEVAVVQSTGADGQATRATVTAPVSTIGGIVVALVADADGQVRQLPVVTATPPVRSTAGTSSATTAASPSSTRAVGGGAAASTKPTRSKTSAPTPTRTRATVPSTTSPAPADPGDVATVITGLTTLTGWEPATG